MRAEIRSIEKYGTGMARRMPTYPSSPGVNTSTVVTLALGVGRGGGKGDGSGWPHLVSTSRIPESLEQKQEPWSYLLRF